MKKIALALFASLLLAVNPALAASGTVGYTPGSGTNFQVTTTGGNDIGNQVLVDPTTPTQQLGITTNSAAKTEGVGTAGTPAGGVASVQGASGGTPLPAALNATPSIANGNGVVPTQSGNVIAAGNPTFTALSIGGAVNAVGNPIFVGLSIGGNSVANANGIYSNLLQGNSVLGVTNGIYANILQGNAALATGNPIFAQMTTGSATIGKTDTLGNAGAIIDFAGQNAASPANAWLIGGQFQTTPTTITPGNASPLQMDNAGNLLVNIKAGAGSGGTALGDNAAWTAGTTNMTPAGCEFTTGGATAITTAHAATVGCTAARAMFTDLESVAATTLGTPAAYGSTPTGNALSANVFVTNTNANGQATAANSSPVVLPAAQVTADPCSLNTKVNFTISTTAGTLQLVAPSGSTQVYICSLFTVGATASIQNIVGGTGSTCTTGTPVAIAGSTTAANGMSFAANGGFTFGNGGGTILRTTTAGHGVCLIQSATAQISGGGTYVQQ